MNCATKTRHEQLLIWVSCFIVFLVALLGPATVGVDGSNTALMGIAVQAEKGEPLYPWQRGTHRWKKWALRRYRVWQRKYDQAKRAANLARLALMGMVPIARVVERLTVGQHRYQ